MKKYGLILVSLLLVFALAVGVSASGSLSATASASKSQVFRSDEVTVVVSVGEISADLGGISVSFDQAALELTSYEWLLSGAECRFNTSQLKGVFAYENTQTISGNFFKCVFKVKADAGFAPTEITFTVKVGDHSVTAKAGVSILCNHSYGNWAADASGTTHTHSCSICGNPETADHTWNGGEVTTPSTCTAEGVKTFTCTACGAQKTEPVAMIEHTWDAGKTTKQASCTEEGEKLFTCSVCGGTKTEPIAKAKHKYDNSCDPTCNVCGGERKTSHKYSDKYTSDETGHWYQCTVCKDKKDVAAHTPGAEPTEQTSQNCTVCGFIIKPALGHTHDYQLEWSADATNHWHACNGCDNQHELAEHSYDNSCDKDCNVCGYERETEHIYYENYLSSEEGHWHECRVCGYRMETEQHTPNANGQCSRCGFKSQTSDHTHSFEGPWGWDVTGHWQTCHCGHNGDTEPHSWDDGRVAKKPTDTEDGARTYKCTVCGAEKSEIIPMGTVITDSFPWMVLLIVGGAVIVGVVIFVIVGVVSSKKKTGRFGTHEELEEVMEE